MAKTRKRSSVKRKLTAYNKFIKDKWNSVSGDAPSRMKKLASKWKSEKKKSEKKKSPKKESPKKTIKPQLVKKKRKDKELKETGVKLYDILDDWESVDAYNAIEFFEEFMDSYLNVIPKGKYDDFDTYRKFLKARNDFEENWHKLGEPEDDDIGITLTKKERENFDDEHGTELPKKISYSEIEEFLDDETFDDFKEYALKDIVEEYAEKSFKDSVKNHEKINVGDIVRWLPPEQTIGNAEGEEFYFISLDKKGNKVPLSVNIEQSLSKQYKNKPQVIKVIKSLKRSGGVDYKNVNKKLNDDLGDDYFNLTL